MKSSSKILLTIATNISLFSCALKNNDRHTKIIKNLSESEQKKLSARDTALRNNSFYHSDNPLLRSMAIARYQEICTDHPYSYKP